MASVFDNQAKGWDSNTFNTECARRVAPLIAPLFEKLPPQPRCMEFGCGTGLVSFNLLDRTGTILGIDSSAGMVEEFNKKVAAADKGRIEARQLMLNAASDLGEARFDLIYSNLALHHIEDCAGMTKVLADLVAPGGALFVSDMDVVDSTHFPDGRAPAHGGTKREDLATWFADAGLQSVQVEQAFTIEMQGSGSGGHAHGASDASGHGHSHGGAGGHSQCSGGHSHGGGHGHSHGGGHGHSHGGGGHGHSHGGGHGHSHGGGHDHSHGGHHAGSGSDSDDQAPAATGTRTLTIITAIGWKPAV